MKISHCPFVLGCLLHAFFLWTRAPGFSSTRSLAPLLATSRRRTTWTGRPPETVGSRSASQSDPITAPLPDLPPHKNDSTDDYSSSSSNLATQQKFLGIRRIEQFARLPVWPAWHGVLIWLVGRLLGAASAAQLENAIGGRVCPNFYQYSETSPFIMLVHHCHTFHALDPLRYVQRALILPEGFPAHPHRGFITITYILSGGFVHRDSTGVRQVYGADAAQGSSSSSSSSSSSRYQGKHTQWLVTGSGMLHEEMFDIHYNNNNIFLPSRQELFQIWLNVPARHKLDEPHSYLLGGDDETPTVVEPGGGAQTRVLAGTYQNQSSAAPLLSDLALFHVTLPPGASWTYDLPASFETAFLYLRQGSLMTTSGTTTSNNNNNSPSSATTTEMTTTTTIPVHHTAYFDTPTTGEERRSSVRVTAANDGGADFMFLAGRPLREPCVAAGSMVMTNGAEIEQAYRDYQAGLFGQPWDHQLSDEKWEQHVAETTKPQQQQQQNSNRLR